MRPVRLPTGRRGLPALKRSPLPENLKARGQVRHGDMNKTEADYADHLATQLHVGAIKWFAFEPMKFRLADNTFYTPDFGLLLPCGTLVLDDVKGRKGDSYFCQEDSKMKIKIVAELMPLTFRIVWPLGKGQGWGAVTF